MGGLRDVSICDETGSNSNISGDIVVCAKRDGDVPREIKVCPEMLDCSDPATLFLSGTNSPNVGSKYTASGGVTPYSWSFAGGSIDDTGEITALTTVCDGDGADGAIGRVTVSDACDQSAYIEVKLPVVGAQYVVVDNGSGGCSGDHGSVCTFDVYAGTIRLTGGIRCCTHGIVDAGSPYSIEWVKDHSQCVDKDCSDPDYWEGAYMTSWNLSEWQCP